MFAVRSVSAAIERWVETWVRLRASRTTQCYQCLTCHIWRRSLRHTPPRHPASGGTPPGRAIDTPSSVTAGSLRSSRVIRDDQPDVWPSSLPPSRPVHHRLRPAGRADREHRSRSRTRKLRPGERSLCAVCRARAILQVGGKSGANSRADPGQEVGTRTGEPPREARYGRRK